MDIHKKFSKTVWMDGDENILGEARVSHENRNAMIEFLSLFDSKTDVVMEATFPAGRASRQLAVDRRPRRGGRSLPTPGALAAREGNGEGLLEVRPPGEPEDSKARTFG